MKSKRNTQDWNKLEFAELNKRTKREIRNDIREYNLRLTRNIIANTKSVKKARKELNDGKYWMLGTKGDNNEKISTRTEIIEAATKFYETLYKSNKKLREENIPEEMQQTAIPPLLHSEVRYAIHRLNAGKSPGEDGIINEYLK